MTTEILHDNFTIERTLAAPARLVFKAWSDPAAREIWGPPSNDDLLKFTKSDFRVGGLDVSICGPEGNMDYRIENYYLDIVQDKRLIFTESISTEGTLLSTALATVDLQEKDGNTRMLTTIQIISLAGEEMNEGVSVGWHTALDNLAIYLGRIKHN